MSENLKTKVIGGLFWKILEQAGAQGIQFVVALVLARLMSYEEYGTLTLITVFITVANTFVQSGFATSLIQKQEIREEDYSSVFWLTMGLSVLVYAVLYACAPLIADYYETPVLVPLVRVMGMVLFPGAVISIQSAYIARNMQFKALFQSTLLAVILSGGAAIALALQGFGVWAMAAQQIVYYFALMLILFAAVRWHPVFLFSLRRVKSLFRFGWKILVSGLIDTIWMNIYGLVIGKQYSQGELGAYSRGEQFPKLITSNLSAAIQSVMLPAYAKHQDDPEALRLMCRRSIKLSAFLIFPMMAGLIAVSRPLITLLLTDKWLLCAPYLCIMCLSYAVWPIHVINLQVMNAMGRSELFLKLEIIKKALGIVILVLSLPFGIMPMLLLKVADEYLCTFINAYPNRKLIGYGPLAQWRDVLPSALSAAIMCVLVYQLTNLGLGVLTTLVLQMVAGVLLYTVLSFVFNRESFDYVFGLLLQGIQSFR